MPSKSPALFALFLLLAGFAPAFAQPLPIPAAPSDGAPHIEWEVKNRFRLFREEADFKRHVAADRGDGVLAAERRLERDADGQGWARDMVERLCVDQSGRLPEFCQRDGAREVYLSPTDHRIGATLMGAPVGANCAWTFDDGEGAAQQMALPCSTEAKLRVRYGRTTTASVTMTLADGSQQQTSTQIAVRDFLVAGMGDSIAAGEGNPDRPITLDDGGFCYRRFFGGVFSEYFRPGRAGFRGNKACDPATPGGADSTQNWARLNARWLSAACHRSLYGYQMRAALAIAVENTHSAVTYLPLSCSGATIETGFFNAQRVRECPPTGNCPSTSPAQLTRLKEALALAQKSQPERKLDLVLLTIGANDIGFSGLVADVIVDAATERALLNQGGMMSNVETAEKILEKDLPSDFTKLRAALKPLVGGNLANVVFVNYGSPLLAGPNQPCAGGPGGFDVHPAFNADPTRLQRVANFVTQRFLPRMKAIAHCDGKGFCRDPLTDRMTFVDGHQGEFANHGFCAVSENDPPFDRECFSAKGESFASDPAVGATDPLLCNYRARDFRPYASRARWIRTANDSYFTAMTYPEGIAASLQPSDLHDATWGATSAVYGGAIHPTAEGHAAMADAALPAIRDLLLLPAQPTIRSEPLPPLQPAAQ